MYRNLKLLYLNRTDNKKVYKKNKLVKDTINLDSKQNKESKPHIPHIPHIPNILNMLNCTHSIEELKNSLLKKNDNNFNLINKEENKISSIVNTLVKNNDTLVKNNDTLDKNNEDTVDENNDNTVDENNNNTVDENTNDEDNVVDEDNNNTIDENTVDEDNDNIADEDNNTVDENTVDEDNNIASEDKNNDNINDKTVDQSNINTKNDSELNTINVNKIEISIEQEKRNRIILQNRIILENAVNNINQKFDNDIKNKMEELEKIKNDFLNIIKEKRQESIKYIETRLSNSEIPLIIFQTWITKNLPPKMLKTVNKVKTTNPEFEHRLFDDNDIRIFLSENFNPDVLYAFNKLIPGAFKADLWRYCVLYIYGGIYLDIKYEPVNNFKFLEMIDKEYYTLDRNHFGGALSIYNGFIVAKPGNEIFLKLISKVVENVKSRFYGNNALQVTGPTLMAQIMFPNSRFNDMCNSFNVKYSPDGLSLLLKGKKVLHQYPEYRKEQSNLPRANYQSLWEKRGIYS
jgi:mannosyltransferase OCH1-like enzyme